MSDDWINLEFELETITPEESRKRREEFNAWFKTMPAHVSHPFDVIHTGKEIQPCWGIEESREALEELLRGTIAGQSPHLITAPKKEDK